MFERPKIDKSERSPEENLAQSILEDDLYKRRRSAYYLAKVAHILEIRYTDIKHIEPEDVYKTQNNTWTVLVKTDRRVIKKVCKNVSDKDMFYVHRVINSEIIKASFNKLAMLIAYLVLDHQMFLSTEKGYVVGFHKGSATFEKFKINALC